MLSLSLAEAQKIILAAQGLAYPASHPAVKKDVLSAIRQMGLLQIDTISVVARSPYLVLFSRLGSYQPDWLDETLAEGLLFEYWGHAACFIPAEDYRLYRRAMLEGNFPHYISPEWLESRREMVVAVYERIRREGPLKSSDFNQTSRPGTWWSWKDEKNILERLFNEGKLMIRRREKFQRVYDLQERIMPGWSDEGLPQNDEIYTTLVTRTIGHLGLTAPEWIADYYRLPKRAIDPILKSLLAQGAVKPLTIQGFERPWCYRADQEGWLQDILNNGEKPSLNTVLSPFDPLVWDRKRTRESFNFDYSLECYLPQAKRRFGYFSLPLLIRGRLVGRLDAKAHRLEGLFEVKRLVWEENEAVDESLLADTAMALKACAAWHGIPQIVVRQCDRPGLEPEIERLANGTMGLV